MALKIEFSAQFKDAQVVQAAVKSLQKELVELGKTGANASAQLNKSMQGVADSIAKINQLSKGAGGLKDLNTQLDSLVKMSTGIQSFARSFDAVGRAVNANLGSAANTIVKQFKANISSMQAEVESQTKAFTRLQDRMGFLKDKYGESSPIYQRAMAYQSARATSIAYGEEEISEAKTRLMMAEPRRYLGGMSLGGAMKAGSAGYAVSELAYGLSTMGIRGEIAQRRLAMQAGQEAAQGDPTLAITRGLGIGIESGGIGAAKTSSYAAEYFKEGLKYAGIIGAGILTGGVGALVTAGTIAATTGFRGVNEINADAIQRQRALDKALFSPVFEPAYGAYQASSSRFYDLYKMRGDSESNRLVARMMSSGAGLSMEQLSTGLGAASFYGLNMPGYGSDIDLMSASRDYGISDYALRQLVRVARVGGPYGRSTAMAGLSRLIGGSGVSGDINARRVLADATFRNLEGMGGQTDIAQAGALFQATTRAAGETGLYSSGLGGGINVEGAQVAVQAGQMLQQQMQAPGNFVNMMYDMKLISLGVTDIGVRQSILSVISRTGVTEKIIKAIQKIRDSTGKTPMSEIEIRQALQGAGKAVADIRARVFGVNTPQAKILKKEAGIDVGGELLGGPEGATGGLFDISQKGIASFGGLPGEGEGAKFDLTGSEVIAGGRGKMSAKQLEAFEELGEKYSEQLHKTIYGAISEALIDTGNEIARGIKNATAKEPDTIGTFTGTGNSFSSK